MLHDSARLGAMLLPGICFTSASYSASCTMNGVCWMLSAGSSQAGTSVVCTAQVIWPAGASACAGAHARAAISARANEVANRVTVVSLFLEPHVFVRGRIRIAGDQTEAGVLHPGPDAAQDARLPERREHRLLVHELLDAVERPLAPLAIQLPGLVAKEPVDVGVAPVDVHAARRDEGLDAGGGVAEYRAAGVHEVLEFLLGERLHEGRPLEGPQLQPEADGAQVVDDGLGARERQIGVEIAGVEPVRVSRLGEQRFRPGRIVRGRRRRPVEIEAAGNDAARYPRRTEQLGLVVALTIDGEAGGLTDAPVVPGRLRVPLVEEVDPERRVERGVLKRQPGRSTKLFGERTADQVGYVDLAALQRDQPRRLVRDHPEDQPLDARSLAPEMVGRLQNELDARIERDELVRAGSHRRFLEAFLADRLDILLRHDPARAGGVGIEGHEVRPRLLETEADAAGFGNFDGGDPVLDHLGRRAPVTLERELHVLGGHRIAVVEAGAAPERELVDEP